MNSSDVFTNLFQELFLCLRSLKRKPTSYCSKIGIFLRLPVEKEIIINIRSKNCIKCMSCHAYQMVSRIPNYDVMIGNSGNYITILLFSKIKNHKTLAQIE